MKACRPLLLMLLVAALPLSVRAGDVPQESYEGWRHRALSAREEPLVAEVERVFSRVLAAADRSEARPPRLVVIGDERDPYAAAVPDGTVVVSLAGVRACYAGVDQAKGEARLAFVLGHELSHLSKNDFWHATAYRAVQEFASRGQDLDKVAQFLADSADVAEGRNREVTKVKELQADSYGIVYMAMAGFDPHAVLDRDGTNFFQDYLAQITGQVAYDDPSHPSAGERAEFLRTQLAKVAGEVELFQIGVRFYQAGRYRDALTYFNRFRELFPSRELFNNLGLSHYQLALERLSACDPALPYRFKLPALLDADTRAQTTRDRGEAGAASACFRDESYRAEIGRALGYLELAQARDASYLPARLNLASAAVMAGDYARALVAAEDALRIEPGNPEALGVKALALYLFGGANGIDATAAALAQLAPLATGSAPLPAALYNLAALQAELGRPAEAHSHLERFLALEKTGPHAAAAQRKLGQKPAAGGGVRKQRPRPPIPLGGLQRATQQTLRGMHKREFVIGMSESALYQGQGMLVLVRTDRGTGFEVVDLVQVRQEKPVSVEAFRASQGPPRRELPRPSGAVLVYDGFLAEVEAGAVRSLTFVNRESI